MKIDSKRIHRLARVLMAVGLAMSSAPTAFADGGFYVSMFAESFEKNERVAHTQTLKCQYLKGTFEQLLEATQKKVKDMGLHCIDQRFTGTMQIWCRPDADVPNRMEFYVEAERGEFKCRVRAQKRLADY